MGFTWAINTAQCQPTTPLDLLIGGVTGGLNSLIGPAWNALKGRLFAPKVTAYALTSEEGIIDATGYQWAPSYASTDVLGPGEAWHHSQGVPVIGRLPDTVLGNEMPGYVKFNFSPPWTVEKNDAWIQSIINQRGKVYVVSPTNKNYWNVKRQVPVVFAREVQQLLQSGYRWKGDYLVPPK